MTTTFEIHRDGWHTRGEDAEALATASVTLSVGSSVVTRNVSKRTDRRSESLVTSLLPLAQYLAQGWWALLYEPLRPLIDGHFRARHRLDSGTRGYAFPALAIWSAGDHALLADWAPLEEQFANISFVEPSPRDPVELERDATEIELLDFIATVISRVGHKDRQAEQLAASWARITETLDSPDETAYCIAAGRLGLDPYDPDSPDLEILSAGVSDTLFADAAEVIEVADIAETTDWLRLAKQRMSMFPEIRVSSFGNAPDDDLRVPAYRIGEDAAHNLRAAAGYSADSSRQMVNDVFGPAVARSSELSRTGPHGISGVCHRSSETMQVGIVAQSARQRRFRACAAAYMGWIAQEGEDRAATLAYTRRQQASRAFAAELLAPQSMLAQNAPKYGLDSDDIQSIASMLVCPYDTVMWQAYRAGVPLRGINLQKNLRPDVISG